jgi:hypothetical protein
VGVRGGSGHGTWVRIEKELQQMNLLDKHEYDVWWLRSGRVAGAGGVVPSAESGKRKVGISIDSKNTCYTWSSLHLLHLEPTTLATLGAHYTCYP